jgi:DNA-binding NarL/FixJ family response regulator
MDPVAVAVLATDPVTREGAVAMISSCAQLRLVDTDRGEPADVLLVLAEDVTSQVLAGMEQATKQADPTGMLPIVLVANGIGNHQLLRAIEIGLVSLLVRQESGFAQIVDAILAVGSGKARLPEDVVHSLVHQVRAVGRDLASRYRVGLLGLADREVQVLRLLSEGLGSGEVAVKLNYSERTVKNIINGVLARHHLRNRTHAVAYALRHGAL